MRNRTPVIAALVATILSAPAISLRAQTPSISPSPTDQLANGFANPPQSARPRVWWHWMNGNVTKDGIREDLEWMKRSGIGGLQNFDANLLTPQIVDKRLVYMHPEWKDAFRFAATNADRLGLEMAIAASPGWSETGGPWVKPGDGLKKLVWTETAISGGKRFLGTLAAPPSTSGPFMTLPANEDLAESPWLGGTEPPALYGDVAVLAYPSDNLASRDVPTVAGSDGKLIDGQALLDNDLKSGIDFAAGSKTHPSVLSMTYARPQTIQSASFFIPGAASLFATSPIAPSLEASIDGNAWTQIAEIPAAMVPTTVSFAPVTARYFRLVLRPQDVVTAQLGSAAPGADTSYKPRRSRLARASYRLTDWQLSGDARIDQFERKAGYALVTDYYALSAGLPDMPGVDPSKVVNLTGRLKPDGSLDWIPPKGNWRVIRLGWSLLGTTNHPAPPEATGLEVDKFDGDAVRRYLEYYLGMYRDAAGNDLVGKRGVSALLTDSIEVGAANWTPKMIDQFKRLRGYDPTRYLPALTGVIVGSRDASDKFLYDYRRTLADLISSEHYATIAAVAHENEMIVYGEALENGRPSLGDDMTMRSHTDVPMAAMWTYGKKAAPTFIADIKGAASVAHIYGQNIVAAESMTSFMSPWAFAPNDLRRVIDLEFVTGVNRPVIHTSVHQPVNDKIPGLSLAIFGQYFNRHETWAEMARPWVDYMARTGFMLQQGRNYADVAYFYGEEAPLTGLYRDKLVGDAPVNYAYDFANVDVLLNRLAVEGGELVAKSGARYRILYLGGSSRRMTLPVLRRLDELVESGAVVAGDAPEGSPSLQDDRSDYQRLVRKLWGGGPITTVGKGRVIAGQDVQAALKLIGVAPDFAYGKPEGDSEILFAHRRVDDGDIYFVNNRQNRSERIEARFRVTGKIPEIWRADTGKVEAVSYRIESGETVVPLNFGAEDSFFVVFRKASSDQAFKAIAPSYGKPIELSSLWAVTFQPNRGAPESVTMAPLAPLSEQSDPRIRYFSGIASYSTRFNTRTGYRSGQPMVIDLGKVGDVAEVRVNGQLVGTAWHAPWRLDIGSAVKPGVNQLEIRVANLWVNRLIGDQQPGAKKLTYTALPSYTAAAPLRPSGLLGPVRIIPYTD